MNGPCTVLNLPPAVANTDPLIVVCITIAAIAMLLMHWRHTVEIRRLTTRFEILYDWLAQDDYEEPDPDEPDDAPEQEPAPVLRLVGKDRA